VSLILGTGTVDRSVREIAAGLLSRFDGLEGLRRAECHELAREYGLGLARAVRLHAAIALGRRSMQDFPPRTTPITTAAEAQAYVEPPLRALREESLFGLYLDRRRHPLALRRLTLGTDEFTIVEPRQIFRIAIALGARGVILAHNHPSGDPSPSKQDRQVTRLVASAGQTLGCPLMDHLIVGNGRCFSFREANLLNEWPSRPPWVD
jgi:DNA repair protein RadC